MQPQSDIQPTPASGEPATLLVSFELSQSKWVLTFQHTDSSRLSRVVMAAHDTEPVLRALTQQRSQAERRIGRAVRIISIYEAGLDGFWLHR